MMNKTLVSLGVLVAALYVGSISEGRGRNVDTVRVSMKTPHKNGAINKVQPEKRESGTGNGARPTRQALERKTKKKDAIRLTREGEVRFKYLGIHHRDVGFENEVDANSQ